MNALSSYYEFYQEYKKRRVKSVKTDVEWLLTDSNEYNHMLYEQGELHVAMDQFVLVRDHVRMLWGCVLNWLDLQPSQKAAELSEVVADAVKEMESENKFDTPLWAFALSTISGKIGDTYLKDDGSYCYEALMAYKAFNWILCKIIATFEIPESEREMPLYPRYEEWVTAGLLRDVCSGHDTTNAAFSGTHYEKNQTSEETNSYIMKANGIFESEDLSIKAFRKKIISACKV
jgi:hypothetical protein